MTEATVRAQIKAVVAAVADIGQVHDYERWAIQWPTFLERFRSTIDGVACIRGWLITCTGIPNSESIAGPFPEHVADVAGHAYHALVVRTYEYKIMGYLQFDDANESEKTAFALGEAVCDALDRATTLHSEDEHYGKLPCATLAYSARMFGNVLCHFLEITQSVREVVPIA